MPTYRHKYCPVSEWWLDVDSNHSLINSYLWVNATVRQEFWGYWASRSNVPSPWAMISDQAGCRRSRRSLIGGRGPPRRYKSTCRGSSPGTRRRWTIHCRRDWGWRIWCTFSSSLFSCPCIFAKSSRMDLCRVKGQRKTREQIVRWGHFKHKRQIFAYGSVEWKMSEKDEEK